jgi:hypothetical protein
MGDPNSDNFIGSAGCPIKDDSVQCLLFISKMVIANLPPDDFAAPKGIHSKRV